MNKKLFSTIILVTLLASILPSIPVIASPSDLVGLWHFDEGIGTTAHDSSGYSNDGTISDVAMWTTDSRFGPYALEFDGIDDRVDVDGLLDDIVSATEGTISFWAKIDLDDNNENVVFAISRDASSTRTEVFIVFDMRPTADNVYAKLGVNGVYQWRAATPADSLDPYVGQWLHVAVVHDGTEASIYFNGVEQTLTWSFDVDRTKWFKPILTDATNPSDSATVGLIELGGSDFAPFDGVIDELRIWKRALSADEIESSIMIETYYTDALFCDNFENALYTGANWMPQYGTWDIMSDPTNKVYRQSQVLDNSFAWASKIEALGSSDWENYLFEVKVKVSSTGVWGYGPCYRVQGAPNYGQYVVQILEPDANRLRVYKGTEGSPPGTWTKIADAVPSTPILADHWYTIIVEVVGEEHTVTVKDETSSTIASVHFHDGTYMKGSIGLNAAGLAYFDDVCVTALPLNQYGVWNPDTVTVGTLGQWAITVKVTGGFDDVENVMVQGGIGADLIVLGYHASEGTVTTATAGKGNMGAKIITWSLPELAAGEEATLTICVATGKNPKDKQEYTQFGTHYLDGGFSATYSYGDPSVQYKTFKTDRLPIEAK